MNTPLVSVVVPTYNAEPFLDRCYRSLAYQTLSDIEFIFIDDGSTDATAMLLDELAKKDSRMVVIHKTNEGQGIARNVGMGVAKASYIGFMDVDDYVDADMYERLYEASEHGNVDVVWSFTKGNGFVDKSPFPDGLYLGEVSLRALAAGLVGGAPKDHLDCSLGMSVCKCLYKRLFLESHDIEFQSERVVNSEDILFNMDALGLCNSVKVVDRAFYYICTEANPDSFSKMYDAERLEKFKHLREAMLEKVRLYDRFHGFEIRTERRFIANVRVSIRLVADSKMTVSEKGNAIRDIVRDASVRQALESYPIEHLPLIQRVFFYYARKGNAPILFLLTKLRYQFKG